jgi:hypothetical protein
MGLQGKTIKEKENMSLTTNRIRTTRRTKLIMPASTAQIGTTAGWAVANNNGLLSMAASQTAGTAMIPITGLSVGDTIIALRLRGGTATADAKTLAWGLWKAISASGAITATVIQAMTTDATATAHAIDIETYLTTPYRVTAKENYYVLLTGTTAALVTIDITSVEVDVAKTYGQEI